MKHAIILLLLLCTLFSCKKSETDTNPYKDCPYAASFVPMTDPGVFSDGLMQFKLKGGWAFADSSWQDGVLVHAGIYDLYVDSAVKSGEDIWWRLSDGYVLCQQNDTVYKLNFNGEVQPGAVSCPEKTVLYYKVPSDTSVPWYEVSGDVLIPGQASVAAEAIHTGIGTYSNCFKFNHDNLTRYISPGLGIVKIVSTSTGFVNEKTLVGFHVLYY